MPVKTYRDMDSGELVNALGDDASKWAEAFQEIVVDQGLEINEGLMIGWFANAIEGSYSARTWIIINS